MKVRCVAGRRPATLRRVADGLGLGGRRFVGMSKPAAGKGADGNPGLAPNAIDCLPLGAESWAARRLECSASSDDDAEHRRGEREGAGLRHGRGHGDAAYPIRENIGESNLSAAVGIERDLIEAQTRQWLAKEQISALDDGLDRSTVADERADAACPLAKE
jgi:hypothetical protein